MLVLEKEHQDIFKNRCQNFALHFILEYDSVLKAFDTMSTLTLMIIKKALYFVIWGQTL